MKRRIKLEKTLKIAGQINTDISFSLVEQWVANFHGMRADKFAQNRHLPYHIFDIFRRAKQN